MRKIASFQNIRNVAVFALVFLSQRPSPGPSWVTQHPSVTFDGKQKNVSVSKYATRIKTAFHQNGKEVHDDHSQQVSFSTSLSPFQTKSAPPFSVATQAWTRPQAKGLARLRWQSGKRLKIRTREQNGTVRFLNGWRLQHSATTPWPGKSLSETTAIQFLEKNSDIFNIDQPVHEWRLTDSQTDPLRNIQVAFSQLYEGLEVWPSSLTVQLNEEGHVEEVYGAYVPTPTEVETSPGVLESKARSIANEYLRSQRVPNSPSPGNFDVELLIHAPVSGTPRLAYSLQAHHLSGLDWRVFVDAHTGKVLSALNHICSAAVKGLAVDPFGHQQSVELWLEDGSFAMVDTTKSMYQPAKSDPPGLKSTFGGIFVYDANNVSPKQKIVPYTPSLISSSASDSGFGPDAVSASVNLSKIYDYYEIRHERHSIDGRGGNIIGIVNVPLANAYWQNGIISLGNVGNYARALDVVSHEVTHGVIESTADLIFRDQSGAISEAFSDIFGEAAEAFHNQGSPDWAVGTLLNNPLRNLRAPSSIEIVPGRPYPSRMSEFITPSDPLLDTLPGRDNGGVHLNSTIISHAFYQLAEGLPESISLLSAERIFYRALTTKLQKQAQFVDCRIACVRSAEELFGLGSSEARQTALAFSAVEIFDQIPLPEQEPVPIVDGEDLVLFTIVDPLDGQTYLGQADPSSTTNPIVGAWQYGDGAANDSGIVVFLNNGIYFHAEDTVESGVDFDGMERGDYTWDETTGELDALAIVDTNGEEGLSESRFSNSFTATIAGDSLVINDDGERFTLGRVFSTTNPIVGAWQYGDGAANDSGVVVFLNNGIYFHAENYFHAGDTVESGFDFDGMERGDYTWDETTGELDALAIVDTNGEEGLSESRFSNSFTATIAGDSLVINDDGERFTLGRVLETMGDDEFFVMDTPIAPDSRPAVSRDGSIAIVVTADFRVAIIDPIALEGEVILDPGEIFSVALSPDGRYLGAVFAFESEPLNNITVIDLGPDWDETYEIKAPTRTGTGTDTVELVDTITFTADGQSIYCDGLNTVNFSNGDVYSNWNIYSVDLQTKGVVNVFPSSSGGNFANPSLGRAFVDHLLYETEDIETGNSLIYIKDLTSGAQQIVGESSAIEGLAYPDFFGDDSAIAYSDYPLDGSPGGLIRQGLANDGFSPIGNPTMWFTTELSGAVIGAIFRQGSYEGLNSVEVSTATDSLTEAVGVAHFSLQRSGPTTEPLTVQFVTVGSAIPGRDYLPIQLFATFPPGETVVDIPISILDDSISEPTKTLNFSLIPKLSYILGEHDYAKVEIIDNDETDSLQGYDLWAQERGARGPIEDLDLDHRPNLVEYAVGSDPTIFDEVHLLSSNLMTVDGKTYFTATLQRRVKRSDVTYKFDFSDNLKSWQPANGDLVIVEDSDSRLVVRMNRPVNNAKQTYLRLRLNLLRPPWPSGASLATGFSGAQLFSTFGAVKRFDEPDHCGVSGEHPFWFSYQAPRKGRVTMSTDGSDFDTVLAVYRTPEHDFTKLLEVACDNDSGIDNEDSALSFDAEANEIYYVAVDGVDGAAGFVNLSYKMDLELSLRVLHPNNPSPDGTSERSYSFVVEAESGIPFTIESSEDLILWKTRVTTVVDEIGQYEFRDPDFSDSSMPQFYRVYYPSQSP